MTAAGRDMHPAAAPSGAAVFLFLSLPQLKSLRPGFGNERNEDFDKTFEVKARDVLLSAVSPEGKGSCGGGRLTATMKDIPPASEPESGSEGSGN